jgi:hypothetical protein
MLNFKIKSSIKFKNIIDTLKDITTTCNVIFNDEHIIFQNFNIEKSAFIHYKINAHNVINYKCIEEGAFGINLINFSKVLKCITYNSLLNISINNCNNMNIDIINNEENITNSYNLMLLDTDENCNDFNLNFENFQMFNISSMYLKKQFKNSYSNISISCNNNQLIISSNCEDNYGINSSKSIKQFDTPLQPIKELNYDLNNLKYITRCFTINKFCKMYLKEQNPLVIQIENSELGVVSFIQSLNE